MEETPELPEVHVAEPIASAPIVPEPIVPSEPISSRFLFVDVAALRAKQLRRGALARLGRPVTEPVDTSASVLSPMTSGFRMESPHKPERVAMEEVRRCLVAYSVVPVANQEQA